MGLHLFYHHGRGTNITGLDLYNLMVTNVTFNGVSGDVAFNSGGIGSEAYGRGDRVVGLEYQLVNFDPKLFHAGVSSGATALANVGTWLQDTNTFTPCDQDTDALCSFFFFKFLINTRCAHPRGCSTRCRESHRWTRRLW